MLQLVPFSTILQEADDLTKVNAFLSGVRRKELRTFQVTRLNKGAVSVLFEVQFGERFRIVASSPEDGSLLQTGNSIPSVQVVFSEPVLESSLSGQVYLDGVVIGDGEMSLSNGNYRLTITPAVSPSSAGQHRLEFIEVKSESFEALTGRRVIGWSLSEAGGSKEGSQPNEEPQRYLALTRVAVEAMAAPHELYLKFLRQFGVSPDRVVDVRLVGTTNEYEKTELFILYEPDEPVLAVTHMAPLNGACMFWDEDQLGELQVSISFDGELDEDSLSTSVFFNGELVNSSDIEINTEDNVVVVTTRPEAYGHHWIEIRQPTGSLTTRVNPFFSSFVLNQSCCNFETSDLEFPSGAEKYSIVVIDTESSGHTGYIPPWDGTTRKFLVGDGNGVDPNIPTWAFIQSSDLPSTVVFAGEGVAQLTNDAGYLTAAVTSVALTMPNVFSVSGSPITSSGTFTVSLANQSANTIFAGPTSGGAAAPTFRSLVEADIPTLSKSKISSSGTFPWAEISKSGANVSELNNDAGYLTTAVTSVALTMPSVFSVAGSPVTTTGTFAVTLATQQANKVWAGPSSGGDATPTFRALVQDDIPTLAKTKISSAGTFAWTEISKSGSSLADLATRSAGDLDSGTLDNARLSSTVMIEGDDVSDLNNDAGYLVDADQDCRTLEVNHTPTANTTAGPDDLMTYTLPGGTLGTNKDYIEIDMGFFFAVAATNKRVKVYFGGTTIFDTGSVGFTGSDMTVKATVIRNTGTTQTCYASFSGDIGLVTQTAKKTTPAETLSSDVTIKATVETSGGGGEATQSMLVVRKYRAP